MTSVADAHPVSEKFRVAVFTAFYVPAYLGGGPIQTLKALIDEAPDNVDVRLVCGNNDLGDPAPLVAVQQRRAQDPGHHGELEAAGHEPGGSAGRRERQQQVEGTEADGAAAQPGPGMAADGAPDRRRAAHPGQQRQL